MLSTAGVSFMTILEPASSKITARSWSIGCEPSRNSPTVWPHIFSQTRIRSWSYCHFSHLVLLGSHLLEQSAGFPHIQLLLQRRNHRAEGQRYHAECLFSRPRQYLDLLPEELIRKDKSRDMKSCIESTVLSGIYQHWIAIDLLLRYCWKFVNGCKRCLCWNYDTWRSCDDAGSFHVDCSTLIHHGNNV